MKGKEKKIHCEKKERWRRKQGKKTPWKPEVAGATPHGYSTRAWGKAREVLSCAEALLCTQLGKIRWKW